MFEAVIILYVVVTVAIGLYLSKRVKKASDFLIAGRQLGLSLTTATLAAIQVGAGVILGGAELGAQSGVWPGMWYGLGCRECWYGGCCVAICPRLGAIELRIPLANRVHWKPKKPKK